MTNPAITREMRELAAGRAGSWLYLTDPRFDGANHVPPWAVRGGYRIGADGEIGEYRPNPEYRSTPEPENELEDALLDVLGGGPEDRALDLLRTGEVFVVTSEDGTEIPVFSIDGAEHVAVYTSKRFVPDDAPATRRVALREISGRLADRTLAVNPDTVLALALPSKDLLPHPAG